MKQFLAICFLFVATLQINAQNTPQIDSDEMQQQMESAMSELQNILDTMDISQLFNSELGGLFGEGMSKDFDIKGLDSLGGFNLEELFGGDMSELFGQGMPNDLDMNQINEMMEMSLKMMEQIDMSEFQKMFEGLDFNFEELEEMMPKGDEKDAPVKEGEKNKKRKTKKI